MEAVEPRVRIGTEDERNALQSAGLHESVSRDHFDDVVVALNEVGEALKDREEVDLEEVLDLLVGHLRARPEIKRAVEEAADAGGASLSKKDLFRALAAWCLDRKFGDALLWPGGELRLRND